MDDPRFTARSVHPATGAALEHEAWRTIPTAAGTSLRSTRRDWHSAGAGFVAVLDRTGATLRWWAPQHWATPAAACEVISGLAATAGRGATLPSAEHGVEFAVLLDGGSLRAARDGSHLRVAGPEGGTLDGGLWFWTCDDLAESPGESMAEILDAAELLR